MTLTLEIDPRLEARLRSAASVEGLKAEEYAVRILEAQVPRTRAGNPQKARELLRRWREEGDLDEQTDTWNALKEGLEENRLSNRKLFP
jgi:hypothetical protein